MNVKGKDFIDFTVKLPVCKAAAEIIGDIVRKVFKFWINDEDLALVIIISG